MSHATFFAMLATLAVAAAVSLHASNALLLKVEMLRPGDKSL